MPSQLQPDIWEGLEQRFGRNMRRLRESRGMSQTQLAKLMTEEAGINWYSATVKRIESGEQPPKLGEALAVSWIFGMNILHIALHPDGGDEFTVDSPEQREVLNREWEVRVEVGVLTNDLRRARSEQDDAEQKARRIEKQLQELEGEKRDLRNRLVSLQGPMRSFDGPASGGSSVASATDDAAAGVRGPGKFELYKEKSGQFRFRLKAGNGEIIAVSEAYATKEGAMKGIESFKANALTAPVEDYLRAVAGDG